MNIRIISITILLIIFSISGAYYNNILVENAKKIQQLDKYNNAKESSKTTPNSKNFFDLSSFITQVTDKTPLDQLKTPQQDNLETSSSLTDESSENILDTFCQQIASQRLDINSLTVKDLESTYKDKAQQYYDFLILVDEICKDGKLDYGETIKIVEKTSELGIDLTNGL